MSTYDDDTFDPQNFPWADHTEESLVELMKRGGQYLQYVPETQRTYAVCLAAVTTWGGAIREVPEAIQIAHSDVCIAAVSQCGCALGGVKCTTPELYSIAVAKDGCALAFVPAAALTPQLCDIAFNQNPTALMWLPQEQRTAEKCAIAIKATHFNMLRYVPAPLQTREMCLEAVRIRPQWLEDVHHQTPDLCLAATENGGSHVLRYVRDHAAVLAQYPDFYYTAIRQYPYDIQHVPHQTLELCLFAVQQRGEALRFIKDPTYEVCLAAVKADPQAIRFVPERHLTSALCLPAVQQRPDVLKFIDNPTYEVCLAAVKVDKRAVCFVPERHRTPQLSALCARRTK